MKYLLILVISTGLFFSKNSCAEYLQGKEAIIAYLVTSDEIYDVRLAAELTTRYSNSSVILTDIIAEVFWSECKKPQFSRDTHALLAKSLASSLNKRYLNVIDNCINKYKKNNRHIKNALLTLKNSVSEEDFMPYAPESIQLQNERKKILLLISDKSKNITKESLKEIKIGNSIDNVLQVLSYPDQIQTRQNMENIPGTHVTLAQSDLKLTYANIGAIYFSGRYGSLVSNIVIFNNPAELDVNSNQLHQNLNSTDVNVLLAATKDLFFKKIEDPTTIDVAANRLWKDKNSKNDIVVDALAWICRAIGQSGNARYRAILQKTENSSASRKVRKYARAALESISKNDAPQFEVESQ